MLWDLVLDFYIEHIFGGINSLGDSFDNTLGQSLEGGVLYSSNAYVKVPFFDDEFINGYSIPLGNYLSLIATIITMVAILLFCVFIIKKIIAIIFRLFTGSSAF